MAKVPYGVETLPKISIAWVGRTNVTDDRQTTDRRQTTDGRTMTYSDHELEFTFANKTENTSTIFHGKIKGRKLENLHFWAENEIWSASSHLFIRLCHYCWLSAFKNFTSDVFPLIFSLTQSNNSRLIGRPNSSSMHSALQGLHMNINIALYVEIDNPWYISN